MTLNNGDKTSGDVNQEMKEKNTKCHSVQCDPRTESYSELCQWTKEALVQWAAHCETVRQFNSVSGALDEIKHLTAEDTGGFLPRSRWESPILVRNAGTPKKTRSAKSDLPDTVAGESVLVQKANAPPQIITHEKVTKCVEDALRDSEGVRVASYRSYSMEQDLGAYSGMKEFQESLSRYLGESLPADQQLKGATMLQVETTCTSGTIRILHVVSEGAAQWRNIVYGDIGLLMAPPTNENLQYAEFYQNKTEEEFCKGFSVTNLAGARFVKMHGGDTIFVPGGWLVTWFSCFGETSVPRKNLTHKSTGGSFYANSLLKEKPEALLLAKRASNANTLLPRMCLEEFLSATLLDALIQQRQKTLPEEAMLKIPHFSYAAAIILNFRAEVISSLKINYIEQTRLSASMGNRGPLSWSSDERDRIADKAIRALSFVETCFQATTPTHSQSTSCEKDSFPLSKASSQRFLPRQKRVHQAEVNAISIAATDTINQQEHRNEGNANPESRSVISEDSFDSWCILYHPTPRGMKTANDYSTGLTRNSRSPESISPTFGCTEKDMTHQTSSVYCSQELASAESIKPQRGDDCCDESGGGLRPGTEVTTGCNEDQFESSTADSVSRISVSDESSRYTSNKTTSSDKASPHTSGKTNVSNHTNVSAEISQNTFCKTDVDDAISRNASSKSNASDETSCYTSSKANASDELFQNTSSKATVSDEISQKTNVGEESSRFKSSKIEAKSKPNNTRKPKQKKLRATTVSTQPDHSEPETGLIQRKRERYNHQTTCHLCGNLRSGVFSCPLCPKVFCSCCVEKKLYEHGVESFQRGCPGCQHYCCCHKKSNHCENLYHCYRKCPLTRKGKRPRVECDRERLKECSVIAQQLIRESQEQLNRSGK